MRNNAMQKILRIATYLGVMAVFAVIPGTLLPQLFDPTQTGKFIVFSGLVALLLLGNAISFMYGSTARLNIKMPDLLLLAFFLYVLAGRYLSGEWTVFSLRFNELLAMGGLYMVLRNPGPRMFAAAFAGIVAGALLEVRTGYLQYMGASASNNINFPVTGSFFNPGPYAGYLASTFPVVLGAYIMKPRIARSVYRFLALHGSLTPQQSNRYSRYLMIMLSYLLLITAGLIILAVLVAGSRAASCAIAAGMVYLLLKHYAGKKKIAFRWQKWQRTVAAVLGVFLLFAVAWAGYAWKKDSADGRLLIWKVTSRMFLTKPLTGFGYDHFSDSYMRYQSAYFQETREEDEVLNTDDIIYPFNEPLQFLVENGGIMLLLMVTLYTLLFTIRVITPITLIARAGVVAILTFSLFSYPSQILPIKINLLCYLTILVIAYKPALFSLNSNKDSWLRPAGFILVLCMLGVVAGLGIYLQRLRAALQDWGLGSASLQTESYAQSVDFYRKAYPLVGDNGDFLSQFGQALSKDGQYKAAQEVLLKASKYGDNSIVQITLGINYQAAGEYALAEQAYRRAWWMVPSRFYPLYLLARLYDHTGQRTKAVAMGQRILSKKIKIRNKAMEEILFDTKKIIDRNTTRNDRN